MDLAPGDQKVVELLSNLKNSNGTYPADILAARREAYLKQIANVGLGIGVGAGLTNAAKGGNGTGVIATATSKILEIALIAAIAIEAGAATYLYRDKIADVIKKYTGSSAVQETIPSTDNTSSNGSEFVEATTTPRPTSTEIPTFTAVPPFIVNNNDNQTTNNSGGSNPSASATPIPSDGNGNHYGQTPEPERTKDNNIDNGSNTGGGNGNNNKP